MGFCVANNENYKIKPIPTINSTANSAGSKVVEDVISDNFKKIPNRGGRSKNVKILPLQPQSTKICVLSVGSQKTRNAKTNHPSRMLFTKHS